MDGIVFVRCITSFPRLRLLDDQLGARFEANVCARPPQLLAFRGRSSRLCHAGCLLRATPLPGGRVVVGGVCVVISSFVGIRAGAGPSGVFILVARLLIPGNVVGIGRVVRGGWLLLFLEVLALGGRSFRARSDPGPLGLPIRRRLRRAGPLGGTWVGGAGGLSERTARHDCGFGGIWDSRLSGGGETLEWQPDGVDV